MDSLSGILLAALAAFAVASPVAESLASPADPAVAKRTSCTFSGSNGAALAKQSQSSCATIVLSNVAVPSGVTLDLSDLNDGTIVRFEGETTWGYAAWPGPLLQIQGNNIKIEGAPGAVLNPDGARWWDGNGGNGGVKKPKFFSAHHLTQSSITNLNIRNTPVQAVSISNADGLTITNVTIDNSAGDSQGGHNTDGFDIGNSRDVVINRAKVYNQDDCVAVNSGTDITFDNGLCSGGHGLSIGSVGGRPDNTVARVTFSNSVVKNSANGIRIKARSGETGNISGVTYRDITLQSISNYGILIEQNYNGGDLHGAPTSRIPITGLTIQNIRGSGAVGSRGYNIAIACGDGACSNWTWSNVDVTGGKRYGSCSNVPSPASC